MLHTILIELRIWKPWSFYSATIHSCDINYLKNAMKNNLQFQQYNGKERLL